MDVVNWHPEVCLFQLHLLQSGISLPLQRVHQYFALNVQDGFQIESTSGQIYSDVDLSDGEWVEYDEKLGESVGIMDLEHRFLTHK